MKLGQILFFRAHTLSFKSFLPGASIWLGLRELRGGKWVDNDGKIWKMDRIGPIWMKICVYDVKLSGEFDGNGLKVVRAQKRRFLSKKLDWHPGF